jgi:hypothetical protein
MQPAGKIGSCLLLSRVSLCLLLLQLLVVLLELLLVEVPQRQRMVVVL